MPTGRGEGEEEEQGRNLPLIQCAHQASWLSCACRYAAFLAVVVFDAMIFNQFSYARVPGATGSIDYYIARLSEYGIGMVLALLFTIADPW